MTFWGALDDSGHFVICYRLLLLGQQGDLSELSGGATSPPRLLLVWPMPVPAPVMGPVSTGAGSNHPLLLPRPPYMGTQGRNLCQQHGFHC